MCSLSRPSCSCCFFCTFLRLLLPPLLLLHSATIFWVSDTGWYPSLWGCSDGSRHRSNAYVDVQGLSLLAHTSQLVLAFAMHPTVADVPDKEWINSAVSLPAASRCSDASESSVFAAAVCRFPVSLVPLAYTPQKIPATTESGTVSTG